MKIWHVLDWNFWFGTCFRFGFGLFICLNIRSKAVSMTWFNWIPQWTWHDIIDISFALLLINKPLFNGIIEKDCLVQQRNLDEMSRLVSLQFTSQFIGVNGISKGTLLLSMWLWIVIKPLFHLSCHFHWKMQMFIVFKLCSHEKFIHSWKTMK